MATRAVWNSLFLTNFRNSLTQVQSTPRRSLFHWITIIFNRFEKIYTQSTGSVDQRRIDEVGPDRACAEWLLKNGAAVKWKEDGTFLSDYNALPSLEQPRQHIQAVDATNSAISHIGFPHFNGCDYINEVKLVNCVYIENEAIQLLSILKKTLNHLEVHSCLNISGKALLDLDKLTNLKTLKLGNLPEVKDKGEVIEKLTKALPNCNIEFK